MIQFDHLTVIAPNLEEGIEYIRSTLDIEIGNGAIHHDMGTHNRRLKLGDSCYLEVVSTNPGTAPGKGPRWFGLDRSETVRKDWDSGRRLKGWVARTNDIDTVLASFGHLLGDSLWLENAFNFAVLPNGELPMGGVLPCVIDRGDNPLTATRLDDQGLRLNEFILEHPSPETIKSLFKDLKIGDPPQVVEGRDIRFAATIETPGGVRVLK